MPRQLRHEQTVLDTRLHLLGVFLPFALFWEFVASRRLRIRLLSRHRSRWSMIDGGHTP